MEYFAFQWHITEACDQRCKHCYIYALGSHAQFKEMALDDMDTVIANIQTFCGKAHRLPYLYITGGDPILHPRFWTLTQKLRDQAIPFAILGGVILGLLSVWFLVRCILGAYYLAQGVAYPRPNTWLI